MSLTREERAPSAVVCGLANLGNTCYVNTSVQCLSFCPRFLSYVLAQTHEPAEGPTIVAELRDVLHALRVEKQSLIPRRFVNRLQQSMGSMLNIYEQNDIHEFLMIWLDKMCRSVGRPLSSGPHALDELARQILRAKDAAQALTLKMERAWMEEHHREYSPLKAMFYGQQIMQIQCGQCGHISHNYETFSMLPVCADAAASDAQCLHQMILNHMKTEPMEGWSCESCKTPNHCSKTYKFWRLPDVLMVVVKRFTAALQKLRYAVEAPPELDLSDLCIFDDQCRYRLCATACHMGGTQGGHYYALCRDKAGWWVVDDTSSKRVEDAQSFQRDAYICFYERITV